MVLGQGIHVYAGPHGLLTTKFARTGDEHHNAPADGSVRPVGS
jgi:hypothetical protein